MPYKVIDPAPIFDKLVLMGDPYFFLFLHRFSYRFTLKRLTSSR